MSEQDELAIEAIERKNGAFISVAMSARIVHLDGEFSTTDLRQIADIFDRVFAETKTSGK